MFESVSALSVVAVRGIDPTDHGSNLGVVAGLAVAILAFIGLLVFLITRWGKAGAGTAPSAEPESTGESEPESRRESTPESSRESTRGSAPAPAPAPEPGSEPAGSDPGAGGAGPQ